MKKRENRSLVFVSNLFSICITRTKVSLFQAFRKCGAAQRKLRCERILKERRLEREGFRPLSPVSFCFFPRLAFVVHTHRNLLRLCRFPLSERLKKVSTQVYNIKKRTLVLLHQFYLKYKILSETSKEDLGLNALCYA